MRKQGININSIFSKGTHRKNTMAEAEANDQTFNYHRNKRKYCVHEVRIWHEKKNNSRI